MSDRIVKLTKRTVDVSQQPEAERYILWDSGLKGFGLRVELCHRAVWLPSRGCVDYQSR